MNFELKNGINVSNGAEGTLWLPVFDEVGVNTEHNEMEVIIGDERRFVLSSIARHAEDYTRNLAQRIEYGHDCSVFAYAWETTKNLAYTSFTDEPARPRFLDRVTEDISTPPPTQPGEIIFTADAPHAHDDYLNERPHFLIHATTDDHEPLYFSKFGPSGPVMLTSFAQSQRFYPAQITGVASYFRKV